MKNIIVRFAVLIMMFSIFSASIVSATTYYISSSTGNDLYDGTEKEHTTGNTGPWKHAPGMSSATGNAASYTPGGSPDSQPGDIFIFKGCDVWTNENFPWTIGTTSGWSPNGHYTITGKKSDDIGYGFYGDLDRTYYNSAECPNGWDRPIFDACEVSAPPIQGTNGKRPGCTGNDISVISYIPGVRQDHSLFVRFVPNHVTFSGFEFRNQYSPNDNNDYAVYGGTQYTMYLNFTNNYIHAFIAEPAVVFNVTVDQDSAVVKPINPGDEIKLSPMMPFQVRGTYHVFPATSNGPVVSNIDTVNHQFIAADGGGVNPRLSCKVGVPNSQGATCVGYGYDCSQLPGCVLKAGYGNQVISSMQGYPNSRMTTFEWNIVDGEDSNLVDDSRVNEAAFPNDCDPSYGKCLGTMGGLYQGPENVRYNLFRYLPTYYLGMVGEFAYNRLEYPRKFINPTGHSNTMESLGDSGLGAIIHDNVITGVYSGVTIMFAPREKFTTTGSTVSGSTTIHVPNAQSFCGKPNCGYSNGYVLKLIGAGPQGEDLITYIDSFNQDDFVLVDAPQITSSDVTIVSGALSPSYAWNNVVSDVAPNGIFQLYSAPGGEVIIFSNTVEGGPDPNGYMGLTNPGFGPSFHATGCPSEYARCEIRNNLLIACNGYPRSHNCNQAVPFVNPGFCGSNCYESSNIGQSLNEATSQGSTWNQLPYIFYPSSGSSVIDAGENLNSYCSDPRISPYCSGGQIPDTAYAVRRQISRTSSTSGTNYLVLSRTPNLRPMSDTWDIGAYEHSMVCVPLTQNDILVMINDWKNGQININYLINNMKQWKLGCG